MHEIQFKDENQAIVSHLNVLSNRISESRSVTAYGKVEQVTGLVIESKGPMAALGDVVHIESERDQKQFTAEVVGFRGNTTLLMPYADPAGLHPGSRVISEGRPLQVPVGNALQGRVINALGAPIDNKGPIRYKDQVSFRAAPPHPLQRAPINQAFSTGIKAIDSFIPCGIGQRMGIFAGSGVGKSTLLGMIAGQSEADAVVIALIGERGREVREFIENEMSPSAREKSVVIVATSDEPPIMRLKGAYAAMSIAEQFRNQQKNVLLMMDSVTRFAMAQRELGLSVGELPATKGYTPSVFSVLPQLLERAGCDRNGAITGLFTVLVEGDDMADPIADTVRSILDGHIVLNRQLAFEGQYPAIDILQSVSRLFEKLVRTEDKNIIETARKAIAMFHKNQEVIRLGVYRPGSNPEIDRAMAMHPKLQHFLKQGVNEGCSIVDGIQQLRSIVEASPAENPQLS